MTKEKAIEILKAYSTSTDEKLYTIPERLRAHEIAISALESIIALNKTLDEYNNYTRSMDATSDELNENE